MKSFDVIATIAVDEELELRPADLRCKIDARSGSAVRKSLSDTLNDFSRIFDKSVQHEIISIEEFDEGKMIADVALLDLLGGCQVSLYFEAEERDANNIEGIIDEWVQEFFDGNDIVVTIVSSEELP